ncbi:MULTISPECIES: response regulator transcription factor [Pandoraea]|jgi:two-component system response regulator TctD|uniref:Chemotaxis protein CheY n=1 Tax=Pandoraea pnomenusa TaxID=93220 RepID=A0A378YLC7_9BURK|nr:MULTISPECIES: response regulator transcription factor [Pandoraea]AHB04661.1 chemotaxis protein CheY [Pandoraea pnomenusa 3kgm]AHB74944.1 DNA-binding response regulator [Pandoraea pnomenusa]AHN76683.1 DNA-binding response regulator [Pandoraea pnomenusa]AIU26707.1 two-component system response regulator [Pandoraea pnomenusa]ANC43950.1 DNA-binding response regulator [Pandoraea pnomenusa]
MRIMLVEDTADVAEAIATQLRKLGHALDCETDGAAAAARIGDDYDLLILDVMLPHVDGFELLRRVRERGLATRVLMLTACAEIEERVRALDLGADDYLTKPFDFRELEARVRALMRRTGQDATNRLACANLTLDRKSRGVEIDGQPIELTRREVTLLEILAARPGRIFGKDELMDRLYGDEPVPNANAIEQYVARLRKKLAAAQFQIRTLRGLGYQLVLS